MVVLSALAEEHERPRLEPTSEVVPVPLDLVRAKQCYFLIEKFACALLIRYGSSGRMLIGAVNLAPYDNSYKLRKGIKAVALANFIRPLEKRKFRRKFKGSLHPIGKYATWSLKKYAPKRFASQPFKEIGYHSHDTPTTLGDTTYIYNLGSEAQGRNQSLIGAKSNGLGKSEANRRGEAKAAHYHHQYLLRPCHHYWPPQYHPKVDTPGHTQGRMDR
ncbi:hypothetical protein Cgig2_005782 [Carnegiea gigantea]|uniref:Uncharacterized protein n=1 Tax=Carnegiea gigantea TaxID=171969 RepID=A0A9Q1K093_9CARY|nr:hypothetical protein Cgig2_005782 [Carnegiea gigantea]